MPAGLADKYAATNGPNIFPYDDWSRAANDIQTAVDAAGAGETVWISNGTYILSSQITVSNSLKLSGFTNNGPAIIDGNHAVRCFNLTASSTGTLENLYITRGSVVADNGGGVYMYKGTVRDCVFSNNNVSGYAHGGGMYCFAVTGVIQRCTFVGNTCGAFGGGLYLYQASNTLVDDCVFKTNTAGNGGGLFLYYGSNITVTGCDLICNVAMTNGGGCWDYTDPNVNVLFTHCVIASNTARDGYGGGIRLMGAVISNCWITDNVASNNGGGIYTSATSPIRNCLIARNRTVAEVALNYGGGGIHSYYDAFIRDCVVEGNRSGYYGGGLYCREGTVQNCLILNNVADGANGGQGGGIRLGTAAVKLINCTIVSNYAALRGGGVNYLSYAATSVNCVLYYNDAGQAGTSNYYATATGISLSNCCFAPALTAAYTNYSGNNIANDPLFAGWTAGNYRLSGGSPCINAGVNQAWMLDGHDLDGHHRLDRFQKTVDMGCYEYVPRGAVVNIR